MRFSQLSYIWMILPLIIVVVALIMGIQKKSKIMEYLQIKKSPLLIGKNIMMILGILCIFVSLLGPITQDEVVKIEQKQLNMYVLLDVSKSMLVEDMAPNRLSHEKRIVQELLAQLKNDRVGFIPFASTAYVQMPLTDDYKLAKMFLDVVDTDMIGGGGTNMEKGIRLAGESFERVASGDKVVIIISDGEDQEDFDESILTYIKDQNLKVYSIGIGTKEGGLVPEYDALNEKKIGYKKDNTGKAVVSKLNDTLLKKVAKAGDGTYYQASLKGGEINEIMQNIAMLEKGKNGILENKQYKHWYQYLLAIGLALFLLGYIEFERRA